MGKRSHKALPVFAADFETTTTEDDCRVWAYGYADVTDPENVLTGLTIDEFIAEISARDSITYFHNLKFDAMFMLHWLLTNGYEHTTNRGLANGQFSTLISDTGKMYSMTVRFESGYRVEFRDSLKKLPMSVERVATSFGYEEGKGEIDYHAHRPPGYQPTWEEWDYIRRDVSIIAKAVKQVHIDNGMKRLTVGSDSLAEYKSLKDTHFDRTFPTLSHGLDAEIRQAYRGGYTYADERFKGRRVGSGIVLDVNSLYPYIMVSRPIPYGEPQGFTGKYAHDEAYPLAIFAVTFTASLKSDHIPIIQIKGSSMFVPTEYVKEITEPTTLWVTSVDWTLYNEHYNIDVVSYDGGYKFMASCNLFDSYVDKWSRVKANSKHGIREIAKLHLNSLYGKLATNPNVRSKTPYLKDNVVKFTLADEEQRDPVYTAAGIFITSWARDLTIRAAQQHYDIFAYCDTDSLHLLTDEVPESLEVHPTNLGAWKFEYAFTEAFYIRSKAYLEKKPDGEFVNKIAGVPEHISATLTIDDLRDGLILHGKLTPKAVPGGVVLTDTPYELKLW